MRDHQSYQFNTDILSRIVIVKLTSSDPIQRAVKASTAKEAINRKAKEIVWSWICVRPCKRPTSKPTNAATPTMGRESKRTNIKLCEVKKTSSVVFISGSHK